MKKKNNITLVAKGIFSVAFITLLFYFVRGNDLLVVFSRVNWIYIGLSFLLVPVMLYVSCLKWKILLDNQDSKATLLTLMRIYLIGYFFSNIFPSTVGGDVVRSFYAGKEINNQSHAAVSIFIERFSGIIFLFFLVIFAPLLKIELYQSPYIFVPAMLGVLFLCAVLWFLKVQDPFRLPDHIIRLSMEKWRLLNEYMGFSFGNKVQISFENFYLKIHKKLKKFQKDLNKALVSIRENSTFLLKVVLLTVFFYFLTWINVYFSFLAFGTTINLLEICAIVSTILFVAQLPVTVMANFGFFESVFVGYFLLVGIPGVETFAMVLLLRLKMLTLGGIGFIVYLFYRRNNGSELDDLERFAKKEVP